jgi:hypothetical protein
MMHLSRRPLWVSLVLAACFSNAEAFIAPGPSASAMLGSTGARAATALSERTQNAATLAMVAKGEYGETRTQVITDIDDTVKSSGGVRLLWKVGPALGGIDTQYKRGAFYPGVFQFGAELASDGLPPNMEPAPMAVLTARARELKLFLALKPTTKLCVAYNDAAKRLHAESGVGAPGWGIDCENTVLYGSVAEWILQFRKGWRKYT